MNLFESDYFSLISVSKDLHSRDNVFHRINEKLISHFTGNSPLAKDEPESIEFGPFGRLIFPYFSMGNIDSLKLFGLDELILFTFYWQNQSRYKKVADMGANIGLHSILMSKLGWEVHSYEPDPVHVAEIKRRAALNRVSNITVFENAISDINATLQFTRLKGNRTGSHLKGKKAHVYGEVEEFDVRCLAFSDVMHHYDLIKMDIEGAEADALCSTTAENWSGTDVMLEVGSEENALLIWQHMNKLGLSAYAQKNQWARVNSTEEMPVSYKEGSLFITRSSLSPFN